MPSTSWMALPRALSQHRRRSVGALVGGAVDGDAGNELHQVEVVAAVDRQLLDLLGGDHAAGTRRGAVEQRRLGDDLDGLLDRARRQADVEHQRAVEVHREIGQRDGGEALARRRERVTAGRDREDLIAPLLIALHRPLDGRPGDGHGGVRHGGAGGITDGALDGRGRLRGHRRRRGEDQQGEQQLLHLGAPCRDPGSA